MGIWVKGYRLDYALDSKTHTSKYLVSISNVRFLFRVRYSNAKATKPCDARRAARYSTSPPPPPHMSRTAGKGPGPETHTRINVRNMHTQSHIETDQTNTHTPF